MARTTDDEIIGGAMSAATAELKYDADTGRERKRLPAGVTSTRIRDWANRVIGAYEVANGMPAIALFEKWRKITKYAGNNPKNADRFGWLLAMQAMGHGVGVDDDGDSGITGISYETLPH